MAPLHEGTTSDGIEYSVHSCHPRVQRELQAVFPTVDVSRLLIVPTCQHADVDLVHVGEKIEGEKDRLLERFATWAQAVCTSLGDAGHWADFIDPCSGLPMVHKEGNVPYAEVEALSVLMGYKTANAGCCKVLLHPVWGSAVYPATLVTDAPLERLLDAMRQQQGQATAA